MGRLELRREGTAATPAPEPLRPRRPPTPTSRASSACLLRVPSRPLSRPVSAGALPPLPGASEPEPPEPGSTQRASSAAPLWRIAAKGLRRSVRRRPSLSSQSTSAGSSRRPSLDGADEALEYEMRQVRALEALFREGARAQRPLRDAAHAYLQLSPGDGPLFSTGSISEAVVAALAAAPDEAAVLEAASEATGEPGSAVVAATSLLLVRVVRALAKGSGVTFSSLASQLLWRNRRSKALQHPQFRRVVRDLAWLASSDNDPREPVEEVFRFYCSSEGGRMRGRQWQKVVQLIWRNPVLQGHVKLCDADRLFYSQCVRGKEAGREINVSEFKELLFELAESSGVNPSIIFISVGSHAKRLTAEADEREDQVPAPRISLKGATPSIRSGQPTSRPLQ